MKANFHLTEEELELIKSAAASVNEYGGVSVSQLLRAAGTAVAQDPELLQQVLSNQASREKATGGAAVPTTED